MWSDRRVMDGQVAAIRAGLDEAGFTDTAILAYAAKYASAFYGPFREAVNSALIGDRRSYQQDPANRREGVREAALDEAEGADLVMVKPAGSTWTCSPTPAARPRCRSPPTTCPASTRWSAPPPNAAG